VGINFVVVKEQKIMQVNKGEKVVSKLKQNCALMQRLETDE
jgi:hypothetical protein